ncbi:MAG: hypothetical protein ACKKMS_01860 [Candidatus Nealsonbacteria bacterium]
MATFDIKKIFGGEMKKRPKKAPTPSPKKEEKDPSIFRGKSSMDRGNFMHQLGSSELYRKTGSLGGGDRTRLGKKLFGHGSPVMKKDVEKAEKQLNLGKWGKFKDLSYEDKEKAERLTKGILGK